MKLLKARKGAALVEYGLLITGVALISAAAVSTFGHKTSDLIGAMAAVIPGAHAGDNGPIVSGKLIETTEAAAGAAGAPIALDIAGIVANTGTARLGTNLLGAANGATLGTTLVVEAQ